MNTKTAISSALFVGLALSLNAQTRIYPDGGDNLWTTGANWNSGLVPGKDNTNIDVLFDINSTGKTTLLSDAIGTTYSIGKLTIAGGDLEISGATLRLNSWFASGAAGASADTPNTVNITVSNGGEFSVGAFSMGDAAYTNTNITVKDGSIFRMRDSNQPIGNKANTTSLLTVEKGGTWITQKVLLGSSANSDSTTVAVVNMYGTNTLTNNMSIGEGGANASYNIFGSGYVDFTNSGDKRIWIKPSGTLAFRLQDVDTARISTVSGGIIDGGVNGMFNLGANGFSETNGTILVDFTDFSIDGGIFTVGEQYALAIISSTTANLISGGKITVNGTEFLGDDKEWSLVGDALEDYLKYSNGTYYVMLQYNAIPEPSTYAAIFGALALALAAYRRR